MREAGRGVEGKLGRGGWVSGGGRVGSAGQEGALLGGGGVFGSWAPDWPPGAGSLEPWPPASLAGKEPRKRPLLFLAGSWDIMTASILETLFKAGEIARFGGKNTTTSSNFISTHGNYSNRDL